MKERVRLLRTGLPAGSISTSASLALDSGWSLCSTPPGAAATPPDVPAEATWAAAVVPGTVASSVGPPGFDDHPNYDGFDWWYRVTSPAPAPGGGKTMLRLDGLATLAEVWFNDELVLESQNMFCAYEVDVTDLVQDENAIWIAFRSLEAALLEKRPRPRWKTKLVENQQLRWFRTTLLGRMPGWTPAIRPVGPWRDVRLETHMLIDLESLSVRSTLEDARGKVLVEARVLPIGEARLDRAALVVRDATHELTFQHTDSGWLISGAIVIPEPELWWPRTHGDPTLYEVHLLLSLGSEEVRVNCAPIGFRTIAADSSGGTVQFFVNDLPVFCRGACWTSNDIVSLAGDHQAMRRTLGLAADGHANMVRVGGTMVYESGEFYRECDRLGLLVWQDLMFANMDYPFDDDGFARTVEAEVSQQVSRLSQHPSIAAFCGGSEIEQQAAMFGAPEEVWLSDFLSRRVPELLEDVGADLPYWTSTPTGGALPFHVGSGIAHYFGVGAYRRPIHDARLSGVQFATECLGFSNVPEPSNLRQLTDTGPVPTHHPAWKAGVPRDVGAGWDFEDIRDHYLEVTYGVDAAGQRSEDPALYSRLSRVVTGRIMSRVFDEWRSPESGCTGGLVWFLKDLRPGAGWGLIDSDNRPKPAYHYLKRAWNPLRIAILDRGLDGCRVEVHNETAEDVSGLVRVRVFNGRSTVLAHTSIEVDVAKRDSWTGSAETLLGQFTDPTYSYRFGPPEHVVISASLETEDGVLDRATFWPDLGVDLPPVDFEATIDSDGAASVCSRGLAMDVRLDLKGWEPEVNYFDLLPDDEMSFRCSPHSAEHVPPRGSVEAINRPDGVRLR